MESKIFPFESFEPRVIADARVNWATPLDVIATADQISLFNNQDFYFLADTKGIQRFFYELSQEDLKKPEELMLFREHSLTFSNRRKGYPNSPEVTVALNSEKYLRRIENSHHKPSFYQVLPAIQERLPLLTGDMIKLLVPYGTDFFQKFACDSVGYRA